MVNPCFWLLELVTIQARPTYFNKVKCMMNVIKLAALAAVKKIALAALSEALIKKVIIELLEEGARRTDWALDDRIVAEIKNQMLLWDEKNKQ
jgi:hypothetical protein